MTTHECRESESYKGIKYTLDELAKRVKHIKPLPGEVPKLNGIEIFGETLPKEGTIGGDHIIYINFNERYDIDARVSRIEEKWQKEMHEFSAEEQRSNPYIQKKKNEKDEIINSLIDNKSRAGVLVADVKGHDRSGSFMAGMLHQSFLTGVLYELKNYGKITTKLFEKINTRFYNSSSIDDFFTMIYGEIFESGKFLFVSAGHPDPLVFCNKSNHFKEIPKDMIVHYPPIGIQPSKKDIDVTTNESLIGFKKAYRVNKIDLMSEGDILILYTDGLSELENSKSEPFFPAHLEEILKKNKALPAKEISTAVRKAIYAFNETPADDITYVIIKKSTPSNSNDK